MALFLMPGLAPPRILVFSKIDDHGHMEKTYVITWQSKLGPFTRRGTKFFTKDDAEQLVVELNEDHPDIHHEILNTAPTGPVSPEPAPAPVAIATEDTIIHGVDFAGNTASATPEPAIATA
jgi:hypothetical protein